MALITYWTKDRVDLLKKIYPVTEIRNELLEHFSGRTWRSVQAQAARLGLRKPRAANSQFTCNHNLFSEWNEVSAYLLGYLEADGYFLRDKRLSQLTPIRVTFCTSDKDKEYLDQLKVLTGYTGRTSYREHRLSNGKTYHSYAFTISSRQWSRDLEGKYRIGKIPECITEELLSHYIRGYFDGDGSIFTSSQSGNVHSCFVFSNKSFAETVSNSLESVIGSKRTIYLKTNSKRCWYINLSAAVTLKLINWMYFNSNIYLKRKYERAFPLLST